MKAPNDEGQHNPTISPNTNDMAARAFPSVLDVDHPKFFPRLQQCSENNLKMKAIDQGKQPQVIKVLRIYLAKPIDAELTRGMIR